MCVPFGVPDSWKAENAMIACRTMGDSEDNDAKNDLVVDNLGPTSTGASMGGMNICRNEFSKYSLSMDPGLPSDEM